MTFSLEEIQYPDDMRFSSVFDMIPLPDPVDYTDPLDTFDCSPKMAACYKKLWQSIGYQNSKQVLNKIAKVGHRGLASAVKKGMKRGNNDDALLAFLFSCHRTRQRLFCTFLENTFHAQFEQLIGEVPVVELRLLAPLFKEMDNSVVLLMEHSGCDRFTTLTRLFFDRRVDKLYPDHLAPTWLSLPAVHVLQSIRNVESEPEQRKLQLATWAWSIASLFDSPRLLSFYTSHWSSLPDYLYGKSVDAREAFNNLIADYPMEDLSFEAVLIDCQLSKIMDDLADGYTATELRPDLEKIHSLTGLLIEGLSTKRQKSIVESFTCIAKISDLLGTEQFIGFCAEYEIDSRPLTAIVEQWMEGFPAASLEDGEYLDIPDDDQDVVTKLVVTIPSLASEMLSLLDDIKDIEAGFEQAATAHRRSKLIEAIALLQEDIEAIQERIKDITERFRSLDKPDFSNWHKLSAMPMREEEGEGASEEESMRAEIAQLKEEYAELQETNEALYDKWKSSQWALSRASDDLSTSDDGAACVYGLPAVQYSGLTPAEIVVKLAMDLSGRVRFLPSVQDSLNTLSRSVPDVKLARCILALGVDGLDLVRGGHPMIKMNEVIPSPLKLNESLTVRRDESLLKHRTFNDDGTERVLLCHLNLSYRDRLYFDYIKDEDLMVIGYIGEHLPSAKSSTV